MAVKGSAIIELTNVKTGETESYEENNLVTNALSEILRPIGYLKGSGIFRDDASLVNTYLGGMILFDKQITESVDQLLPPAAASAVGYGAYNITNNSSNLMLGTYNVNESEHNTYSKYMKFVYDFTTSQANGTINCIALTHIDSARYSAYGPNGSVSTSIYYDYSLNGMASKWSKTVLTTGSLRGSYTYGDNNHGFLLDAAEDICYCFGIIDASTIKISKYRAGILSTCVVCNHSTVKTLIESFEIPLAEGIKTTYASWNYEHDDDCLYICTASASTVTSTGSFNVIKISVSDWTVTQYTIDNPTGVTLTSSGRFSYVHRGYVYFKASTTVYKINIADSTDWTKITGSLRNSSAVPQMAINGRIFYEYLYYESRYYYGYASIVNTELNTVEQPGHNGFLAAQISSTPSTTPIRNDPFHWLGYNNTLFVPRCYLGTINNLSRPIEKTSDKTMKITYTIQEV